MASSPVVIPFTTDGVQIAVTDGLAIPANARGFVGVGYDGTNLRFLRSDTSGRQIIVGAAADGAAVTGNPLLIGGSDGANTRTVNVDSAGALRVQAGGATGAAVPARALQVAGSDGTNLRAIKTATDGTVFVQPTDGTNNATVKAASTASTAADTALVVAISPNNTPFTFGDDERLKVGQESIHLFDTFEGAAVNTVTWAQSQSGMTQAVSGGAITLNSGSSTTSGNYSILTSNKLVRYTEEFGLHIQFRARLITGTSTVMELGWGSVATTAAPTNGVLIRVTSAGVIQGVINFGGSETTTTLVSAGYAGANYLDLKIRILQNAVEFIVQTNDLTTINVKTQLALPLTQASMATSDTQPVFMRVYNSGTAGSAAQIICADTGCTAMDSGPVFSDYASVTSVASSASNVTLLSANPNRRGAKIFNDSTQVLYVKYGTTASSTSFTYRMTANSSLELPPETPEGKPWVGQLDGIWASANGNARITETF